MADYAYTPDPKTPSKNKLNISSATHVAAAVAALGKGFRGNKAQIPEADLPSVKKRVAAAHKKFFPDAEMPPILKALEVKVNDVAIKDEALFGTIVNAIACFFRNKEWDQQMMDQNEEAAEEALEDAGILPEDDPDNMDDVQVVKSLNAELRQATYIVLEGDSVDLHGDTYTTAEVAKACHNFNVNCRKAFIDHAEETDQASIVESYIAPVEMILGDTYVPKGTWLAVVQYDNTLWKEVKKGTYTGLSIGAYCKSEDI